MFEARAIERIAMSTTPNRDAELIQFYEDRVNGWNSNASEIGMTTSQATTVKSATTAARDAFTAASLARAAAKDATVALRNAMNSLKTSGGDAIKTIRAFASATNDPNVFVIAQIPPPAAPTPAKPPSQPVQLRAIVEPTGALTIEFKAGPAGPGQDASTSGVLYQIRRRINNESNFTTIGIAQPSRAGARGFTSFTDETLPAGSTNIRYLVIPQRGSSSALIGPASEVLTVSIGVGPDGLTTITGQQTVRYAA